MPQQGGINAPYTRFRGPVLVGQSSDFGIAAVNGGSTAPLISFWNASEFGYYVTSTAEIRFAAAAARHHSITSGAFRIGTTAPYTTLASGPLLVIPCSTATLSSGTLPLSADLQGGAALVFNVSSDAVGGRLWVYTTYSTGWMATTDVWKTTTT